jgi:putative aldouronate transport system substrate-binding protein
MGQFAMDGLILPVSDHLDKLPNLSRIIKEWDLADTIDDISEMDGKFYVLPDLRKNLANTQCFAYREDIFDELGIPAPDTYEDLFNALKELKKAYPDSLGTGELYHGQLMMCFIAEAFGTNGGYSLPWGYSYKFDTKEWYYAPTSDEYKSFLMYMRKLYDNGGLDPEAFIQDTQQYNQKVLNGKYMVIPLTYGPGSAVGETTKLQALGNPNAKFTALKPLAGPTGIRAVKPSAYCQGGIAMPANIVKRDDFDEVMKFCDEFYYNEEFAVISRIGFEGITYDKVDGKVVMRDTVKTANNPTGTVELQKDYGINTLGLKTQAPDLIPEEIIKLTLRPEDYEYSKYLVENDLIPLDDPIIKFTAEQKETSKLLITTLNDYTSEMRMKFIFAKESFDNWDKYVAECDAKGVPKLMEIVNKAWKENNKK